MNRRHHLEQLAGLIAAASATSLLVPLTSARAAASWSHMLRRLVQRGVVVIPKSVRRERMGQNFEVFDFKLDPGEMKAIENSTRARAYSSTIATRPSSGGSASSGWLADACVHNLR